MNHDVYDLIIAALLHDIGKVMQRADIPIPGDMDHRYTDRQPYREAEKRVTHYHVKWTEYFFDKHKPKDESLASDLHWQRITNLAASHHKESSYSEEETRSMIRALIIGDRLSAQWDRGDTEAYEKNRHKKRPLYPVFTDIWLERDVSDEIPKRIQMMPLHQFLEVLGDPDQSPYRKINDQLLVDEYKQLLNGFEKEFISLRDDLFRKNISKRQFSDALDHLCEEYFWCVPSNTTEKQPTNSLYHHSKTTAAIATVVLQNQHGGLELGVDLNRFVQSKRRDYMLLGGDLSGIQDYIVDLNPENSKFAAKTLRARSFKIKITMDMVIELIIRRLGVTRQNVLMNAGGKFMMLLPNHKTIREQLAIIGREVDTTFYKQFGGILSLNLNWETDVALCELAENGIDDDDNHFAKTLIRFFDNLERAKKQKFGRFLIHDHCWDNDRFIQRERQLFWNNICPVCHRRAIAEDGADTHREEPCSVCRQEIELGRLLPKRSLGCIVPGDHPEALFSLFEDQAKLSFLLPSTLLKEIPADQFVFRYRSDSLERILPRIPNAGYLPVYEPDRHENAYILPESVRDDQQPFMTFDEIGSMALKIAEDGTIKGVPHAAVLKGDVDNLGILFTYGLKNKDGQFSLTRFLTFSGMMDLFFARYIPQLIEKSFPFMYIVYSGGDDFALVGPWNQSLEFIERLRRDFDRFTGHHPEIHFSAGEELMAGRAPIKHAFHGAEEALSLSKEQGRDRMTIFDMTVTWDELDDLNEIEAILDDAHQNGKETGVSRQFLYRLLQYHRMHKDKALMYHALLHYDLQRNIVDKSPELARDLTVWTRQRDAIMKNLKIPLFSVLYNNRTYNEERR